MGGSIGASTKHCGFPCTPGFSIPRECKRRFRRPPDRNVLGSLSGVAVRDVSDEFGILLVKHPQFLIRRSCMSPQGQERYESRNEPIVEHSWIVFCVHRPTFELQYSILYGLESDSRGGHSNLA